MQLEKTTLVIGASENEERYSNMAVQLLQANKHYTKAIGNKAGTINETIIEKGMPPLNNIDTVTLYINPTVQESYYQYILSLAPRRIIFNPGTENTVLQKMATEKGIDTINACTLVMLKTGQY